MAMNLFDLRCLERSTAIKAVFLLWSNAKWNELDQLGISREIDHYFDDFLVHLPGRRIRTDQQVDHLMAVLPLEFALRVEGAATILVETYQSLFFREIMLYGERKAEGQKQRQEQRTRPGRRSSR